jgi:hypothetical protein
LSTATKLSTTTNIKDMGIMDIELIKDKRITTNAQTTAVFFPVQSIYFFPYNKKIIPSTKNNNLNNSSLIIVSYQTLKPNGNPPG